MKISFIPLNRLVNHCQVEEYDVVANKRNTDFFFYFSARRKHVPAIISVSFSFSGFETKFLLVDHSSPVCPIALFVSVGL